jgi:hypothetical protein
VLADPDAPLDTLTSDGQVMSFRTHLFSFFVLILVVPMVAIGFLVFRLIGGSQQGKADARANGSRALRRASMTTRARRHVPMPKPSGATRSS